MTPSIDADRTREFVELYSAHQRQLYYFVVTLCVNSDDAAEVLAATNLAAWENFSQFQSGTNFLAWIRQIAWHRMIAHRREKGHAVLLEPEVLERVAAHFESRETAEESLYREPLDRCLAKLRRSDRQLVWKRYAPGTSVKSLAQSLGRSPNALSKALGRIRAQLYDCMRASIQATERELHG